MLGSRPTSPQPPKSPQPRHQQQQQHQWPRLDSAGRTRAAKTSPQKGAGADAGEPAAPPLTGGKQQRGKNRSPKAGGTQSPQAATGTPGVTAGKQARGRSPAEADAAQHEQTVAAPAGEAATSNGGGGVLAASDTSSPRARFNGAVTSVTKEGVTDVAGEAAAAGGAVKGTKAGRLNGSLGAETGAAAGAGSGALHPAVHRVPSGQQPPPRISALSLPAAAAAAVGAAADVVARSLSWAQGKASKQYSKVPAVAPGAAASAAGRDADEERKAAPAAQQQLEWSVANKLDRKSVV